MSVVLVPTIAGTPTGDITGVIAGTGLTGGGTSGIVTIDATGGGGGGATTALDNLASVAVNTDLVFGLTKPGAISTADDTTAANLTIKPGVSSASNGGDLILQSGDSASADSGNIFLNAGSANANIGNIIINTDIVPDTNTAHQIGELNKQFGLVYAGGMSSSTSLNIEASSALQVFSDVGTVSLFTADESGENIPALTITGGNSDTENGGSVSIFTGRVTDPASEGRGGDFQISTGGVEAADGTGRSGNITLIAANNAGSGDAGSILLIAGTGASAPKNGSIQLNSPAQFSSTVTEMGSKIVPIRLADTNTTLDALTDQKLVVNDITGLNTNTITLPPGVDGLTFSTTAPQANQAFWLYAADGSDIIDVGVVPPTSGVTSHITFLSGTWYGV